MDRKQMTCEELQGVLQVRLREMRALDEDEQKRLARTAWEMVQRGVPWHVILASTRGGATTPSLEIGAGAGLSEETASDLPATRGGTDGYSKIDTGTEDPGFRVDDIGVEDICRSGHVRPGPEQEDLALEPPPPLRHEVGRYERDRLAANTRQAIRMARHARRWHEIRKMRNVLLSIDQGYLKRMLGSESDSLNQEINALLRSWAPLVRDRPPASRGPRRRR